MNVLGAIFAWALVLLGSSHFLAAWVPRLAVLRGPWTAGAAVALVTTGLMNAVRSQRPSDYFLRWCTAIATALTAGLCLPVIYHLPGNLLHQPAALATAVCVIFELFCSVAG
jgi:hypothetical protein